MTGVEDELGPHTWQYDALTIARMLSPKSRKRSTAPLKSGDIDALEHYHIVAYAPAFGDAVKYACQLLEGRKTEVWPNGYEENNYERLAQFLNESASVAHAALDRHGQSFAPRTRRIYADLNFIIYDRPTVDGVDGLPPLKPDLMGGRGLQEGDTVYWSPPDIAKKAVDIPVEAKSLLKELIQQCGTYARSLFSADPLRQFALVLAFEQEPKELRFLIFHRGGLSASKASSVTSMDDRKDILQIFLSILSWTSPAHGGFSDWWDNFNLIVPSGPTGTAALKAHIAEVLCLRNCICGRAPLVIKASSSPDVTSSPCALEKSVPKTWIKRRTSQSKGVEQALPKDQSSETATTGLPATLEADFISTEVPLVRTRRDLKFVSQHIVKNSHELSMSSGDFVIKLSNELDTPDDEPNIEAEILSQCTNMFGLPPHYYSFEGRYNIDQPMSNHLFLPATSTIEASHWPLFEDLPPSTPDYRTLQVHVCAFVGDIMCSAKSPEAMFTAVLCAMLGWLSLCQEGFLHCDISIGNVLMSDPPIKTLPFKIEILSGRSTSFSSKIRIAIVWLLALFLRFIGFNLVIPTSSDSFSQARHLDIKKRIELQAERVKVLANDLKIAEECSGFVIDLDMAVKWETYFENLGHSGSRSVTKDFMSSALRKAMEENLPYLQSPVDDLESFYHVTQSAALFNETISLVNKRLQIERDCACGDWWMRDFILQSLRYSKTDPFISSCLPILGDWSLALDHLRQSWEEELKNVPEDHQHSKAFFMDRSLLFAYRGVADTMEIFKKHHVVY